MSAYIVEDETINRIVSYFADCEQQQKIWITSPLSKLGYCLGNPYLFQCKRLAEEMFTLNCQSIEGRYGDGAAEDMSGGHAFVYQKLSLLSRIQVLKSLACFLYQACEGGCEKSPLFKALEEIKGIMAYDILSDMPEYDKAEWA